MTYVPPGGWCLDPLQNTSGIASTMLLDRGSPVYAVMENVLAEILRPQGVTAQQVSQALDTTYAQYAMSFDLQIPEWGELVMALLVPNALLLQRARETVTEIVQAAQRLQGYAEVGWPAPGLPRLQSQVLDNLDIEKQDVNNLGQYLTQQIDQWIQNLSSAINATRSDAYTWAQQAAAAGESAAQQAQQNAENQALFQEKAIETWVQQVTADVVGYVNQLHNQAIAQIQAVETWAQGAISDALSYADQAATTAQQNAINDQAKATQSALAPTWTDTAKAVNVASAALLVEHPEELSSLFTMPEEVPVDAPRALADLIPPIRTLTKVATDCALPNCNTKNRLGQFAHDLSALVGEGALLAFLVAMITKPEETAKDTDLLIQGIITGAHGAVKEVAHVL